MPAGLVFSYPCRSDGKGNYSVVEGVSGVANSLCVLSGDPARNQVAAPVDGVVHLDAPASSLFVTYKEFEL